MTKKRVFVGLSGGVDSSVAALRLLRRGYDVVGVFIKVWQPDFIHCNWEQERLDAMRVAAHLGIPFLTCDAESSYKKGVAEYMIDAYQRGLTPNPDVMCNEEVKFGTFYTWAREHGADYIATGHYAQHKVREHQHTLHRAVDHAKDQTYFLARIRQEALDHTLFPIGDTRKEVIRNEAHRAGLITHKKADSQGICFLGPVDIREFLSHYIELTEGPVLDTRGNTIGRHHGALLYTLGQRYGFDIVVKGGDTRPHYVVARDVEKNTLTVTPTQPRTEKGTTITLAHLKQLGHGYTEYMHAVFRYHGTPLRVHLALSPSGNAILTPEESTTDVATPGQLCVLYNGDECCGSGIIV